MDLLAITLLGFKFSGTLALVVAVVAVVALGLLWFAWTRQRRR
jgi:type IV secretory pathway VirB2 component (pilin)